MFSSWMRFLSPGRRVALCAGLCAGVAGGPAPAADEARPADPAAPEKSAEAAPPAGDHADPVFEAMRRAARARARRDDTEDLDLFRRPDPWYVYPWYPWYAIPQTYRYHVSPPPITHVPRLGLQYNYPYAYQMGFRIPDDSDPLYHEPNLGPFVGVVGAAKARLLEGYAAAPEAGEALSLLKEKKYKEAGRLLARGYRETEDPRYPLLLSEVFFLMGKPGHAEMLLRAGLEADGAVEALPEELASRAASADEFETKLNDLVGSGENKLLAAYLSLHGKEPEKGLDLLWKLAKDTPRDKAVQTLYRYSIEKALR
jgi:hypothetical protein